MAGGALREVFAVFGVEVDPEHNLEKGHKEVGGLKESFEGLVAAFAGSELIHATREFGEELGHLKVVSEQTGIATDSLQELDFAAQLTGGSVEEMNNSLVLLQRSLGHAQAATGPQVQALTELGIAFRDSAGQPKPLNDILPQIFDNFGKLKSSAQQAEVATSLFGRSGVKLLPTLKQGREGMQAFREQLGELGGPVSGDTIEKAEEMNHSFAKMDRAFFNLKATIGAEVFPQVEKLVTGIAHGIAKIREFTQGTTLAETGTLALGVAIAGPLLTALGPLLKPGLKFAAIFLAMDDAIAFLEGKDSVIGAILNGFFGPDTAQGVRNWINGAIDLFQNFAGTTHGIFDTAFTFIGGGLASLLNDMILQIDQWILTAEQKFNGFADALGLDSLKIDTSGAEKDVEDRKRLQAGFQQSAYEREVQGGRERAVAPAQTAAADAQKAYKEAADKFGPNSAQALAASRKAIDAKATADRAEALAASYDYGEAFAAAAPGAAADWAAAFGAARPGAPAGAPLVAPHNYAADFAPAPAFGPGHYADAYLPPGSAPLPPAGHTELHVDARTTVTATSPSNAKDIADAVAGKQKDSWRNAYESLTSRAP